MTPRSTRAALVLAGCFDKELVDALDLPIRQVATACDAIGEIACSSTGAPIDSVVLAVDLLGADPAATIDAVRRVDPTTAVIVAGDGGQACGADAVVPANATADRVLATIRAAHGESTGPPVDPEIDLDAVLGISDRAEARDVSLPLGDVDLVRALMHDPTRFRPMLLDLLCAQAKWTSCSIVDDQSDAPEGAVLAPLRYGRQEHGLLAAVGSTENDVARWARWAACWLEMAHRQRQLKLLAYRDELSGAWNRRFLRTCLGRAIDDARKSRRPLTVMLFDIDDFKQYNDQWGHDAGDEIIREVVRLLRATIRNGDHVCRIGGDEFAVLFTDPSPPREPGSNHPTTVEVIASRFRDQVAKARFPKLGDDAPGSLSISGGLATFPWDATDVESLLKVADDRLLQSKRQGKNCVTLGPASE